MTMIINDLIYHHNKEIHHTFKLSLLQYSQCFDYINVISQEIFLCILSNNKNHTAIKK